MTVLSVTGCGLKEPDFDACGQICATEVTVSAESSGRITELDITEGDRIEAGECVGHIDSVYTWLQKEELLKRKASAAVKIVDAECQTRAQYAKLENLKTELNRSKALLAKDAGTKKQVDDIEFQIAVSKGEIEAQEQTYKNNNSGVESELAMYDVQIAQKEVIYLQMSKRKGDFPRGWQSPAGKFSPGGRNVTRRHRRGRNRGKGSHKRAP